MIDFSTTERPSPPGRTRCGSKDFPCALLTSGWPAIATDGLGALADRRSVRRHQRRTLDSQHLQRAVELRHQGLHLRHIARLLAAPFSTVARELNRLGLGQLRNLDQKPLFSAMNGSGPAILIHIGVKKLAHFRKVGHNMPGNRQQGRSAGVGYDRSTWPSRRHTAGLRRGAARRAAGQSDRLLESGIGLIQRSWRRVSSGDERKRIGLNLQGLCQSLQRPQAQAHPHQALHARDNGKAERFIQTLYKGWAYAMPFQNSQEQNAWVPRYLRICNRMTKHSTLNGRFTYQRLHELLC